MLLLLGSEFGLQGKWSAQRTAFAIVMHSLSGEQSAISKTHAVQSSMMRPAHENICISPFVPSESGL